MAIDEIHRTVVPRESPSPRSRAIGPRIIPRSVMGLAVASMRTVILVVLATLAILVLLPAALAAQAAVGI